MRGTNGNKKLVKKLMMNMTDDYKDWYRPSPHKIHKKPRLVELKKRNSKVLDKKQSKIYGGTNGKMLFLLVKKLRFLA